jgi:hypothetical protein
MLRRPDPRPLLLWRGIQHRRSLHHQLGHQGLDPCRTQRFQEGGRLPKFTAYCDLLANRPTSKELSLCVCLLFILSNHPDVHATNRSERITRQSMPSTWLVQSSLPSRRQSRAGDRFLDLEMDESNESSSNEQTFSVPPNSLFPFSCVSLWRVKPIVVDTGKIKYFFPSHRPVNGWPVTGKSKYAPTSTSRISFHNTAISPNVHPRVHVGTFIDQVRTNNL